MEPKFELQSEHDDSLRYRPDSGIDYDIVSDYGACLKSTEVITKQKSSSIISDNPLDDPLVRCFLQKTQLTRCQLINMSVKELNRRLENCPPMTVDLLKRCRRTLKNRGYAKNCRIKRIATRNKLEEMNTKLLRENKELKDRNKMLLDQVKDLISRQTGESNMRITNSANFDQHLQQQQTQEQQLSDNQNSSNCYGSRVVNEEQNGYSMMDQNGMNQPLIWERKISLMSTSESSFTESYDTELDYFIESISPNTSSLSHNNWQPATSSM